MAIDFQETGFLNVQRITKVREIGFFFCATQIPTQYVIPTRNVH